MIINSSHVGMESAGTYRSSTTRTFAFKTKYVNYDLDENALGNQDLLGNDGAGETEKDTTVAAGEKETTNSSDDAMERLRSTSGVNAGRIRQVEAGTQQSSIERIRERCILHLWEMLFGRAKAERLAEDYNFEYISYGQPRQMNVIEISAMEEYAFEETETMNFSTSGTVVTADGREISFNMEVGMSRTFSEYYRQEGKGVVMCDPLVINLDDDVVGLSDQKFFFDLDADGKEEEISVLENGNAFLALDHNRDGKINDGSELFGTKTGDGFGDLAGYDEDGNGWIDEADSVFEQLKVWVKDADGKDALYSLKEKGLGAIYLGSASTDYSLRSEETGNINGQIRRSGMFLYENGMAGTIAHVDMAKGISESA